MEYAFGCRGLILSFQSVVIVVTCLSVSAMRTEDNAGQLARIVSELQSKVLALQQARYQDQDTIRKLQDKLQQHFGEYTTDFSGLTSLPAEPQATKSTSSPTTTKRPFADTVVARVLSVETNPNTSDAESRAVDDFRAIEALEGESRSLDRLDSQLRELRDDIAKVVKTKEREISATENVAEFRLEADSLRDELLRVKRDIEELRAKSRQEDLISKRMRNGEVTTQWLQRTVEDLRREMTELASSVNVSAAIGQHQKDQASLQLARSDIADLRKKLVAVHVAHERDAAWASQMREDMADLRAKVQDIATGHQKLAHEVAELRDEMKEKSAYRMTEVFPSTKKNEPKHHHLRHRGHWKSEIEELHNVMAELKKSQDALHLGVQTMKYSQSDLENKLSFLETASSDLVNRSSHLGVEQRTMFLQMDSIQHQMDHQDRQSNDLKSTVNNITESGIKKLHASTIQLFKTLEALEDNCDNTVNDIRKEMSKMEFSLAQAQSTLSELREEQTAYEHTLKSMRTEVRKVQMESRKDHHRLTTLQLDVINKTLQYSKVHHRETLHEMKVSGLESKIASLSKVVDGWKVEVDNLRRQVAEKADMNDFSRWERSQDRLREVVFNISAVVPQMTKEEQVLHMEIEKFVKQLPKDCSMVEKKTKSGVYLIQAPGPDSQSHARAVYCDMHTAGGEWLVIQRRQDGHQNFNQNWGQYKEGFGDVGQDFWLGNELIHRLTTSQDYRLRIDLWDAAGRYKYVEYNTFRVLQENDGYRLAIAGYHGNGSDAFGYHNGMAFSTPDRDNDASFATHCGQFYGSGWWYNHCQYVNINGRYSTGVTWYDIDGQEWSELTRVEMKIKPTTIVHRS